MLILDGLIKEVAPSIKVLTLTYFQAPRCLKCWCVLASGLPALHRYLSLGEGVTPHTAHSTAIESRASPPPSLPYLPALSSPTHTQAPARAKVIDATSKYVMPGGIDPHTHLSMPFMGQVTCDDFYRCVLNIKHYNITRRGHRGGTWSVCCVGVCKCLSGRVTAGSCQLSPSKLCLDE